MRGLIVVWPAPYHALTAMLAACADESAKLLGPDGYAKLQLLTEGSHSWGICHDGVYEVCAGLMPLDARSGARRFEAWFVCDRGAARRLRFFIHAAQLTLRRDFYDAVIEARIDPGHAPGEKLARLIGFLPGATPGLWEWRS